MNEVPCDAFRKNPDGSWTYLKSVVIKGEHGEITIGPNMTFNKGVKFMGLDLAALLSQHCT